MAVAVVTGSSTGIGFAIAESLARAGHEVVATMRDPTRAPNLAALAARDGLPLTVLAMDVDSDASVSAAFARILADRGRVDVLVNNAGIAGLGTVEETPIERFRQMMETNYLGAIRCIQAVLPSMRANRSGVIVNVTSVAGRNATPGQSPYCASKFALEALSEALAGEVRAFGIRVAIVEPGVIATPIFGKDETALLSDVYRHPARLAAFFAASLEHPVPPSVVGEAVRDIVATDSWQLRYPVGPDAIPLIEGRASRTDEEAVALAALDDETWCDVIEKAFGLDVRKHLMAT